MKYHKDEMSKIDSPLKMFPSVTPDSGIIESIFNRYCDEYNVKEWYESTFKI
jgi:hypothetical protein